MSVTSKQGFFWTFFWQLISTGVGGFWGFFLDFDLSFFLNLAWVLSFFTMCPWVFLFSLCLNLFLYGICKELDVVLIDCFRYFGLEFQFFCQFEQMSLYQFKKSISCTFWKKTFQELKEKSCRLSKYSRNFLRSNTTSINDYLELRWVWVWVWV